MNPADEHNTHDAILALLDGGLPPDEAARVRADLEADPASAAELAAWSAMFDDLHGIGEAVADTAPDVSMWGSINARLDADFAEDGGEPWTFDRLLDLAEGRLEQNAAAELRDRIDSSEDLKQAYAWVVAVRDELGEHGDRIAGAAPSIDLLPAIMRAVQSQAAEPADLYAALLEWRDGRLPLPESEKLRRLTEESDTARLENEWLAATAADLEAYGDALLNGAPAIDVSEAVMDAVHRITEPETIVTLDAERLRRRAFWRKTSGLAAAAAIALGAGWVWFNGGDDESAPTQTGDPTLATPTPTREELHEDILERRQALPSRTKRRMLATAEEVLPPMLSTTAPQLDSLSPEAVLEARRKAANGDWSDLQQLATLTREEALELSKKTGIPATALVGLADSLNPDEKEKQLLTVVGSLPDSPYLQFELLQAVDEQPPGEAETEEPLQFAQRISDLDPKNALPYYLEAKMYLEAGDPASAIAVLLEAGGLEYATPYSLEAAAHRQSALIASGLPPETAELLAAFNAGNAEADALYNLAVQLLQYGDYYNQIQDYATAQAIFEGVQRFGDQLEAGAVLSQEQLAALDIQSVAIDALAGFYEAQGLVEALKPLTEQSINILSDLDSLNVFFVSLNTMLGDMLNPAFWNDVAGVFLTQGDLAILDYLDDWGIVLESP